jgi:Spy/CpxP family protein refolding chaperone
MQRTLKFFAGLTISFLWMGLWTGVGNAQPLRQPPPGQPPPPGPRDGRDPGPPPDQRPPKGAMPPGRWWDNPEVVKLLGLTADQVKKIGEVFQQTRPALMESNGALRKEEAALEPLMNAEHLDDSKLLPQIDRVAQARADLEKVNARLLIGIRHVLTVEQWKKLQSDEMRPAHRGEERPRSKNLPEEEEQEQ